ncbi:MAG TPA: ABC transporter ATP-binding protein [Candidatus Coproplasma stercoripullorum]|uniref:ABC transporter ATP-binding protein n=1 Tax=Candidatus Coproplasma stercoripullorum TaxID=2840751 RepID=A0A9D1AFR3_9FIRM|nr:ABC transporter ATP-binding protein [Candidatus Coproplasma stercoripullorum]
MKRTLSYLKPYSGGLALGMTVKIVGSAAELVLPYILSYIIDELTPLKDSGRIYLMGGVMLFFALVALGGNIWANRLSAKVAGNMTHDIRYDLFKKTSYLKCRQVDEVTVPSLISRLTSDTYYVNQMVARTMRMGVRAPILLLGGLVFCFLLNLRLALVLLAVVPVVAAPMWLITRKSIPMYSAVQRRGDNMVRSVQEDITGIRVIKALSKTEYEDKKFEGVAGDLASTEFKAQRIMSLTNPLTSLILNLGLVGVIVAGAYFSSEPGDITGFLTYFTIVLNAMLGISKIFVIISRGAASSERIERVLELDERETVEERPAGDDRYAIQFKNVSFSYNGKEDNLYNISFALKRGQSLGIIGATGCGKSTIINLLMRFYDVNSGAVYVGGEDVRSVPADKLREKFGAVFQNDFLMAASVRENIDYGRNLTDEQIERAADCAQAREFIEGLSGGLDYDLAQKAGNLSGGQKQRLLIARALAGDPEIIVLDDSSSALDYATDSALRRAIAREYASATKVIVAQRVSSVKNCDLIMVLDDGRIDGLGTHDELMASCAEYRSIAKTQMGVAV